MTSVGKRVHYLLNQKGKTASDLAAYLKTGKSTISSWGKRSDPSAKLLLDIAAFLNVSIEELLIDDMENKAKKQTQNVAAMCQNDIKTGKVTQRYSLRIDASLFKKIQSVAKYEGRSLNKEIEQAIKRRVTAFEKENGEISI